MQDYVIDQFIGEFHQVDAKVDVDVVQVMKVARQSVCWCELYQLRIKIN